MDFDLSEEQQILVDSVAKFVANDSPVERFRKLRDTERGWDPTTWARMGEFGWLGVAFPEEQGGFGGRFVDLALIRSELRLVISDNGRGFDPALRVDGNGIDSMRKRAAAFGGTLSIDSSPGRGTRVMMTANLRRVPR